MLKSPLARAQLKRWRKALLARTPLWALAAGAGVTPLLIINLAVSVLGHSTVFPLSPFFLPQKVAALGLFARHLPHCLWSGHGDRDALIDQAERNEGLAPGLLHALIEVESEGKPHRISPAGATGLAQLMPATAEQLGVKDPFDSAEAINGGAHYLGVQVHARRDIRLGLAAYNAGPGAVGLTVPRNGETEEYVRKVMSAYARQKLLRASAKRAAHR